MRYVLIVALCALVLAVSASNVVDLTPDNFDSVVDGKKHVFVEFFAPWCGHCKNLAPVWEELADAFVKNKDDLVIAKVDADAHKDLGGRFGVTGFPTLKLFAKGAAVGSPKDYNGGRDVDSLAGYLTQETGVRGKIVKPASKVTVLDSANIESVVSQKDKTVFVEFYAPWCGHCKHLAPDWEKLGEAFQNEPNVVIAKIDADQYKDVGSKYGVTGFPTLKWFGKGASSDGENYEGARALADLVSSVNQKAGTQRQADGTFQPQYGRVAALDELAEYFMSKTAERSAYVTKAESAAAGSATGSWYVKFMKAIIKNGNGWVEKEETRLKGYIADKKADAKKIDDFSVRLNVLQAFKSK